jgi:diguanylate cyclase (GGDEF)-like protein
MRLPWSLIAAALLLVATMMAGSYVDLRNDEMHARHLVISTGLEKIVRLNQELSTMLLVSVLEHNTLRSSSYENVHAKLELTVDSLEKLTGVLHLSGDIKALSIERRELRRVEVEALAKMEAEQWVQAQALLFDEAYVLAQKIYEINSETAIGALNGELTTVAAAYERARTISLVVRAAAIGLLFWAGLMFSRRLGHELAEQGRLRKEIAAANVLLEEKVRARTVELEQANDKLAELSITDGLTGLANRRRFDEALSSEWQRARRQGLPLALAMIDVDEFKAYNDHFGHQAGDECLRRISAILFGGVHRSGELIARYGGEEFVVILPGISLRETMALAESLRLAVEEARLPHTAGSLRGVVTVSIGVAVRIPQAGDSAEELLRNADGAMYAAKRQGRNTVVAAHNRE